MPRGSVSARSMWAAPADAKSPSSAKYGPFLYEMRLTSSGISQLRSE